MHRSKFVAFTATIALKVYASLVSKGGMVLKEQQEVGQTVKQWS
jgi:hypothetical protein